MITEAKAASVRVKRGARWLDENFPGWETRINIETLRLDDGFHCICGQVFEDDADKFRLDDCDDEENSESPYACGFDYATDELLSQANSWISALLPRLLYGGRGDLVATALGFNGGSVRYATYSYPRCTSVSQSDYVHVEFEALDDAWKKLLMKRMAK